MGVHAACKLGRPMGYRLLALQRCAGPPPNDEIGTGGRCDHRHDSAGQTPTISNSHDFY